MPRPKKGERQAKFVERYVSSAESKKRFPDLKQRLAVAYSEYKQARKKRK